MEIAQHCRVMSNNTIDLHAAGEFRKLAERLEQIVAEADSPEERARHLAKKNKTSGQ
jgi:hypothetical protein